MPHHAIISNDTDYGSSGGLYYAKLERDKDIILAKPSLMHLSGHHDDKNVPQNRSIFLTSVVKNYKYWLGNHQYQSDMK
jgi:hypothetical protein